MAKPNRCAVIIYFDLPDDVNPKAIKDWIKMIVQKGQIPDYDAWNGQFSRANFHIDLINTKD